MSDRVSAATGGWDLVRRLAASDPGRPRLTWYGPAGERVELSARTLGNWVAKTANLLLDELTPGGRLGLALPGHWRTVVWLLAGWSVGARTELTTDPGAGWDLLVSTELINTEPVNTELIHTEPGGTPALVAVALPALATSFGRPLPAGALDAAVEVRLQPDAFAPPDPAAGGPELAAVRSRAVELGLTPGVRLLTGAAFDRQRTSDATARWVGPLALDGSVVLHHDLAGLTGPQRDALLDQERAVLGT